MYLNIYIIYLLYYYYIIIRFKQIVIVKNFNSFKKKMILNKFLSNAQALSIDFIWYYHQDRWKYNSCFNFSYLTLKHLSNRFRNKIKCATINNDLHNLYAIKLNSIDKIKKCIKHTKLL